MSEKGVASHLPVDRHTLERVQEEVEKFDVWLEEIINELLLEER